MREDIYIGWKHLILIIVFFVIIASSIFLYMNPEIINEFKPKINEITGKSINTVDEKINKDITKEKTKTAIQKTEEVKPSCNSECVSDSCNGLNFISCELQSNGCKVKINKGKIKGECGVECKTNLDCPSNEDCASNKCQFTLKDCPYECCENEKNYKEKKCPTSYYTCSNNECTLCGNGVCDLNKLECKTCYDDCTYKHPNGNILPYYQYDETTKKCEPLFTIKTLEFFLNPDNSQVEQITNAMFLKKDNIWDNFDDAHNWVVKYIKHGVPDGPDTLDNTIMTYTGTCAGRARLILSFYGDIIQKKNFGSGLDLELKAIQFTCHRSDVSGHYAIVVEYGNIQHIYDSSSDYHCFGYSQEEQTECWSYFLDKYECDSEPNFLASFDYLIYNGIDGHNYKIPHVKTNKPLNIY